MDEVRERRMYGGRIRERMCGRTASPAQVRRHPAGAHIIASALGSAPRRPAAPRQVPSLPPRAAATSSWRQTPLGRERERERQSWGQIPGEALSRRCAARASEAPECGAAVRLRASDAAAPRRSRYGRVAAGHRATVRPCAPCRAAPRCVVPLHAGAYKVALRAAAHDVECVGAVHVATSPCIAYRPGAALSPRSPAPYGLPHLVDAALSPRPGPAVRPRAWRAGAGDGRHRLEPGPRGAAPRRRGARRAGHGGPAAAGRAGAHAGRRAVCRRRGGVNRGERAGWAPPSPAGWRADSRRGDARSRARRRCRRDGDGDVDCGPGVSRPCACPWKLPAPQDMSCLACPLPVMRPATPHRVSPSSCPHARIIPSARARANASHGLPRGVRRRAVLECGAVQPPAAPGLRSAPSPLECGSPYSPESSADNGGSGARPCGPTGPPGGQTMHCCDPEC